MIHDIPGMTVEEHHSLCLGNLACCYRYVPESLKLSIIEGFEIAKSMGFNIKPDSGKLEEFKSVDESLRAN